MKVTRRSFLAALASIPFVGRFVPSNVKPGSYVEVFIPLSEVHTFNGKVIPFELFDPEAEAWGARWAKDRYEPLPWANRTVTGLRDEDLA